MTLSIASTPTLNGPSRAPANPAPVAARLLSDAPSEAPPAPADSTDLSPGLSSSASSPPSVGAPPRPILSRLRGFGIAAARTALGLCLSTVLAPAGLVAGTLAGSVRAGWRAADVEHGKSLPSRVARLAIAGGMAAGAAAGTLAGPAGIVLGALAGPGAVGVVLSSARGAVDGAKRGLDQARRVAASSGTALGLLAGLATVPAGLLVGSLRGAVDGTARAVRCESPLQSTPRTLGAATTRVLKLLGMAGAAFVGAVAAAVNPVGGSALGVPLALGGCASIYAATCDGISGFVEGIDRSFSLAGRVTGGPSPAET